MPRALRSNAVPVKGTDPQRTVVKNSPRAQVKPNPGKAEVALPPPKKVVAIQPTPPKLKGLVTRPQLMEAVKQFNAANKGKVSIREIPKESKSEMQANPSPIGTRSTASMSSDTWMTKHNPYLASLRDPLKNPGARIPDDSSMIPSTTLQVVFHTQLGPNEEGIAGALVGAGGQVGNNGPFMIPQSGINCTINGLAVAGAEMITTNTAGSGDGTYIFSDSTSAGSGSNVLAIPGLASFLNSYAEYARVVSSSLSIRFAGNYTDNDGVFVAGSVGPDYFGHPVNSVSDSQYRNAPGALIEPIIGAPNGVSVTYTPFDSRSLEYSNLGITAAVPVNDVRNFQLNPGMMYVYAYGIGANSPTFLIDHVLNLEVLVQSGVIGFGVRPPLADSLALETARNARTNDDLAVRGSEFSGMSLTSDVMDGLSARHPAFMSTKMVLGSAAKAAETDNPPGTYAGSAIHMLKSPVRLKIVKGNKGNCQHATAETVVEKPMFESVVDGMLGLAKKFAPGIIGSFL
jgi:hypothetical protein